MELSSLDKLRTLLRLSDGDTSSTGNRGLTDCTSAQEQLSSTTAQLANMALDVQPNVPTKGSSSSPSASSSTASCDMSDGTPSVHSSWVSGLGSRSSSVQSNDNALSQGVQSAAQPTNTPTQTHRNRRKKSTKNSNATPSAKTAADTRMSSAYVGF